MVEDGFDEPYGDTVLQDKVSALIECACCALDWYQHGAGTVKGDLVIHDGKLYIIELAPRLSGGFFASHGHLLAYGVDFVGKAIEFALGYSIVNLPQPYPRGFVCQRYVFPAPGDIGKKVIGIRLAAISIPGNGLNTWNIRAGQTIEPVTCHPARWGQALATGTTLGEAQARAELAVQRIKESVVLE